MSKQIQTIALMQVAAVLAAVAAVLVLAVAEPSRQAPRTSGVERIKSLVAVQVESLAARR